MSARSSRPTPRLATEKEAHERDGAGAAEEWSEEAADRFVAEVLAAFPGSREVPATAEEEALFARLGPRDLLADDRGGAS